MARIDGLLALMAREGATELRLGTDSMPRISHRGVPKRLAMRETGEELLRNLLEGVLTPLGDTRLQADGQWTTDYESEELGDYSVLFELHPGNETRQPGFDVCFSSKRDPEPAEAKERDSEPAQKRASDPSPEPPALAPATAPVTHRRSPSFGPELQALLRRAAQMGASDLHIGLDEIPSVRVHGQLRHVEGESRARPHVLLADCLVPDIAGKLDRGESADFVLNLGTGGRIRAHIYRASGGLSAAFRVLPATAPRLADLNLPASLDDLIEHPNGLVIVTGATGSGKSSTLAELVQEALIHRSVLAISFVFGM